MFLRIAGRVEVNAASLNAQGTAGNLIELAKMRVVTSEGGMYRLLEVPTVTGNTVKHWHFTHFVNAYTMLGGQKLCKYCKRGIGYRSPETNKQDEGAFVKDCAGEDVHGFLQPDNQVRRESLFKASFMLPIEDVETGFDTITHNRVVVDEKGKVTREGMMLFKRQYASTVFGFLMSLDIGYVGRLLYSPEHEKVIDDGEELKRGKAALVALLPLLAGELGASRARALPVWRVKELLVAWSEKPIPQLTHGRYSDYVTTSLEVLATYSDLMNIDVKVLAYGINEKLLDSFEEKLKKSGSGKLLKIERMKIWQDIINNLIQKYEDLLKSKSEKTSAKASAEGHGEGASTSALSGKRKG
jgi:CRISPR-associated protein Cst2